MFALQIVAMSDEGSTEWEVMRIAEPRGHKVPRQLQRHEESGLIASEGVGADKNYTITLKGRARLAECKERRISMRTRSLAFG